MSTIFLRKVAGLTPPRRPLGLCPLTPRPPGPLLVIPLEKNFEAYYRLLRAGRAGNADNTRKLRSKILAYSKRHTDNHGLARKKKYKI